MRTIDPYTAERFGRQAASLCLCLRITRSDGAELGMTNHDHNLSFGGTLFRSDPGMTIDSLTMTGDLAPDHGDVVTGLSDDGITRDDIDTDRYASARAEIWRVDFEDVTARLLLSAGTIGEIIRDGDAVRLEYRGTTHALAKVLGRIYQKSCDAQLGDTRCGVDLEGPAYRGEGQVVSHEGLRIILSGISADAGLFAGGKATVGDGPLAGVSRTIRTHASTGPQTELTLWEAFPRDLEGGESMSVTAGCDKRFATCRDRFANSEAFRGFPDIPGTDVLAVQSERQG
ncbi:MAG: DUF2163 domain-containing protein [Pseudomonadota bacterium]